LKTYQSVIISLEGLPPTDHHASAIDSIWLESDDRTRIAIEQTLPIEYKIVLLGIGKGRIRALLETKEGTRYASPFFEVQDLTPVEINRFIVQ
jgi:hypothetical protein